MVPLEQLLIGNSPIVLLGLTTFKQFLAASENYMPTTVASIQAQNPPDLVRKNLLYADVLRCLGTFAVIIIHSSYRLFYEHNTLPADRWLAVNFWETCSRWAVPVFFMLSGMLLLNPDRKETIKNILLKRLPRLILPLFLWSEIYLLWINRENIANHQPFSFIEGLKWIYSTQVFMHLWFIYALAGIYLALPLLRLVANNADKKTRLYIFVVWFIFNGILSFVEGNYKMIIGIQVPVFNIYVGYFLLGYWISELSLTRKQYIAVVGAGLLALISIFFGTYYYTAPEKLNMLEYFYSYPSFTVIIVSIAVFCFAIKTDWEALLPKETLLRRWVKSTSSLSFGIYLSHLLFIEILWSGFFFAPITSNDIHPLMGIPLFSAAVFAMAWILARVVRLIPGLRWLAP